jgi:hypothetical protein
LDWVTLKSYELSHYKVCWFTKPLAWRNVLYIFDQFWKTSTQTSCFLFCTLFLTIDSNTYSYFFKFLTTLICICVHILYSCVFPILVIWTKSPWAPRPHMELLSALAPPTRWQHGIQARAAGRQEEQRLFSSWNFF